MLTTKHLILNLLQLSQQGEEIIISDITERSNLTPEELKQRLFKGFKNIISIEDGIVHLPKEKKMKLVNKAISSGIGLDQIINCLHWREFESFCLEVLNYHDFVTTQNFYFTLKKKRYEIDVIGLRKPLIFAIDAKKWKTGHAGALKKMVKNQINRAKALARALTKLEIRQKLRFHGWKGAKVVPMLVTSKMYEIKIFERVPILPFFKLNQFINDFHYYSEFILQLPLGFASQKTPIRKELTEFF